jgi:hypothetical protein
MRHLRAAQRLRRAGASALLALCASLPGAAGAAAREDAAPTDAAMTGHEIYQRVVKNRFRSFHQDMTLASGDRGGNEQHTSLRMTWEDWRDPQEKAVDGFFSKTLIAYTAPFDIRYTAYLVIHKDQPPNDQFVYLPSKRKVRRVNLRAETIFGTDFSFEDIVPREIESAAYERLPDERVDGTPCFVVEATPKPEENSQYSRFLLYVEKQHFVPIRTRYWDTESVEVKELMSPPATIQDFGGVFVPMKATMRNLQQDTYTAATIEKLEPNPALPKGTFDPRRLEGH